MRPKIAFFVQGIPKPAGSKRGFAIKKGGQYTGRVVISDACKGSRDWKTDVSRAAQNEYQGDLWDCPITLTLTFYMPRPRSHLRTNGQLKDNAPKTPTTRPDVLKLARGVEDALTSIIWKDDSLIVNEHLHKRYGERPGVQIEIREAE